jgi:hypothetical protein
MQGIGFTDEVSDRKINAITARITERFAKLPRPLVTFARPAIRTEAIYLPGRRRQTHLMSFAVALTVQSQT